MGKSKNQKRRTIQLWAGDTEDNSKGVVKLINFYNGEEHFTFVNQKDAIRFFYSIKGVCQFWFTNLSYDLWNIFGEYLNVCEITYIESRVISAKITGTQIHFRDSLNHWKMSVAEMGKRIGLLKVEGDLFDGNTEITFDKLKARCERDTEILWNFVNTMKGHYEKIGCLLKATIGSTAMEFYYRNYGVRHHSRIFTEGDIRFMLKGYYGGRVEIFHTKAVEGNIQYVDFNSLYPAVMSQNFYPRIEGHQITRKPNFESEGIVNARIRTPTNMFVPYLPVRSDNGGLIFPLGTIEGHWTYFEIRRALELGYKIERIFSAIEFPEGVYKPFTSFVETLYSERLKAKAENDELLSDSYKLIMNNLYGKFAQGNEVTKLIPFEEKELKQFDEIYGNMILRKIKGQFPTHTNVIWSAYTTAYGRDKLFNGMQTVIDKKGLLLYCDTDSIIFESNKKLFRESGELGELKLEGTFDYAHFKLPKLYRLQNYETKKDVCRAKGVPRKVAAEFFETGHAQFSRPYRMREALRRNMSVKAKKLIPNFWDITEKEIKKTYDKRQIKRNGTTEPLKIGQCS